MVEIRIDLSEEEAKNLGHTAAGNPVTKENACIGVRFESDLTYSKDESNFVEYPHGFADRILAEMAAAESGWSVWCNSWLKLIPCNLLRSTSKGVFLEAGVTCRTHRLRHENGIAHGLDKSSRPVRVS